MICEQCKKNVGAELRNRVRKVNEHLHTAGMVYYSTLGQAVTVVDSALSAQGFDISRTNVRMLSDGEYRTHAEVGEGKYVTAAFHKMESGRFELVAYVS